MERARRVRRVRRKEYGGKVPSFFRKKADSLSHYPVLPLPLTLYPETECHYGVSPLSKPKASEWLAVRLTVTSLSEIRGMSERLRLQECFLTFRRQKCGNAIWAREDILGQSGSACFRVWVWK